MDRTVLTYAFIKPRVFCPSLKIAAWHNYYITLRILSCSVVLCFHRPCQTVDVPLNVILYAQLGAVSPSYSSLSLVTRILDHNAVLNLEILDIILSTIPQRLVNNGPLQKKQLD